MQNIVCWYNVALRDDETCFKGNTITGYSLAIINNIIHFSPTNTQECEFYILSIMFEILRAALMYDNVDHKICGYKPELIIQTELRNYKASIVLQKLSFEF